MLLATICAALAIFCIVWAGLSRFMPHNAAISARVRQYAVAEPTAPLIDKPAPESFWEDLADSKISDMVRNVADRVNGKLPQEAWFDLQAQRAGLPFRGSEIVILTWGSAILFWLVALILTAELLRSALIGIVWGGAIVLYLQYLAKRRMKLFAKQLGEALALLSNTLKAGFSFTQAMDVVARDMNDPIATEFKRVKREMQLGVTLDEALTNLTKRINSPDLELLVMAVLIQHQVGGNLTKLLDSIGRTIRERLQLQGEIRVMTAEGIISGWVVGLLPFGLAGLFLFINPNYFDGLLKESFGIFLLIGGIANQLLGAWLIRRLVKFKL